MKNKVIVIGEEFWFTSKESFSRFDSVIKGAEICLDILRKNINYDFIILQGPKGLISKIKSINPSNIKALFFFHDPFSDSILNKMTIKEIYNFLYKIEKEHNIYIYPGLDKTMLFASKKYYKILVDELPYMALPKSKVLEIKNYQGKKSDNFLHNLLFKFSTDLLKTFKKIIIKKGYSYSGKQVKNFNRNDIVSKNSFLKKVSKLNYKKFWEVGSNASYMDRFIDRYYILQGYNKIVSNRFNEYRVFFVNGKATYISWKDNYDNLCTNDVESTVINSIEIGPGNSNDIIINYFNSKDKPSKIYTFNKKLLVEILRFAKKSYLDFLPHLNKLNNNKFKQKTHPIILRLDISYAIDKLFQDEYSIKVEGFEEPIRIYINEIEIDPTHYFYNNIICKSNKVIDNVYLQKTVATSIIKILNDLN